MKKHLFILLTACLLYPIYLPAQFLGGFFNQNATQRKYLLEQIAALKVYADYVQQGNRILKDGTGLIGDIKSGDLSLHKDYFNSLKSVNSSIGSDDKVKTIQKMESALTSDRQSTLRKAKSSGQLTSEEIMALKKVMADLAAELSKDLDELRLVITDGQLSMSDDERIKETGRIYDRVTVLYGKQMKLSRNIAALIFGRSRAAKDAANLKSLYGF